MSLKEVEHRVRCGWLLPRHREVFAVGFLPRTRESRWSAAVLALGPGALLSHQSAGALWGIVGGPVQTHVVVSPLTGRGRRDGIVVHRQRVPDEHRSSRAGIPCTTLVRTVLDLAAVLPLRGVERVFEEAQIQGKLPPEVLGAEVMCRPGHRGSRKLRIVLQDAVDPAGVRSILELRFLRLCAAYAIPRPLVNARLGIWTPDFLWTERGLVVETDGVLFHRTPAKLRRDAEKTAWLEAIGLTVLRLRWSDVVDRPAETARTILDILTDS